MICKKCGSAYVNVQAVTRTFTKNHGVFWWLFVSWWIWILWIIAFIPMLIIRLIRGRRIVSRTHTEAICQNCGYRWKVWRHYLNNRIGED